ncbi:hypothetical protein FA10DRAFT_259230 [Acaromyces ingoldii]|uniref:Uncharacterized protein n=1 Tax=Acaromyces ingoldii TaxID=215250 RepID=A0A316YV78_9BASI|nr:hypothetical protein FA10DRAFT_259230 [Acaromyces ingoldii]PWN91953.1 hypothetical protein FA10DRAFT_259230 [Acaromyces ingoldii]
MATSAAAATPPAPRLTKCPPIRISLWRMPSDGESGVLVWDSQVEVPDIWGTEGHDLAELEDMSVTASCWTKKGREATLVVQVSRKDVKGARPLKAARYLCIYNVQTGAQERAIPIDESPASVVGLTWVPTDELEAPCTLPDSLSDREVLVMFSISSILYHGTPICQESSSKDQGHQHHFDERH